MNPKPFNLFFEGNTHSSDDESTKCEESTVRLTEDTTNINSELVSSKPTRYPDIIDEAKTEIEFVDYLGRDNAFESVLNNSAGIKVLIIHSHSSEKVSQSLSVIEAGEVIAQLLNSSGIKTLHFTELHDENGRIGAYNRMKDSIERLKDECPELILIIDLHGSEEGFPLMFDIGVSPDYAWKENLRIATVIYNKMDRDDCTVRLLPQELGQNTGILSLNVSIGNNNADDTVSRELIADLALGIALLFTENTPA